MRHSRPAFVSSDAAIAREACERLKARYRHAAPEEADVIVALGGDGFMLETLHRHMSQGVPIYGMNRGTIGFLMNTYSEDGLTERLERAEPVVLHPLSMSARTLDGGEHQALAINEVSLLRETRLTAKIGIEVDGVMRLDEVVCDGVLLCTPAGSTAYNLSVQGPIIPLTAGLLALTPISAFRPRRWRGALLPEKACVTFHVREADLRTVSASADFTEVRDVVAVTVRVDVDLTTTLLFDPEHDLEERVIKEQFMP